MKFETYHRTYPIAARQIIEHGVEPAHSIAGAFGQGFYSSTHREAIHGTAEVAVAIQTRHPLIGHVDDLEPSMDALGRRLRLEARGRMTPEIAAGVRRELLNLGYDAIIIRDAGGESRLRRGAAPGISQGGD